MATTTQQLISILEDIANALEKTQANLEKCPKSRLTKGYIETKIKILEDYWMTYKSTHKDLIKAIPKENRNDLPYFVNEEYFIYEDLYTIIHADLNDALTVHTSQTEKTLLINQQRDNQQNSIVQLPRIQLPQFSGNYDEWPTFQDLFISLVHDSNTLSDVQKLHYLKTSVTGEAEHLLRNIRITEQNYLPAWQILKTRYGNKRLIVNSVLKRLFNQKKENTQTSSHIKYLLDTTNECLSSLINLEISVDSWDPVIIYLIVQKLDPESHKEWEQFAYNAKSEELPTWKQLKEFLEAKYRTLELVTQSSAPRQSIITEKIFHVATTSQKFLKSCSLCHGDHTLCHCKDFSRLQISERRDFVKNNSLCFNCFNSGHSVQKCRLQVSCRICNHRHHSLLHQDTRTSSKSMPLPVETSHSIENDQDEMQVNTAVASVTNSSNIQLKTALLATAMVLVRNEYGHKVMLRALIDQGSQSSFISEKAAQYLKLKRQTTNGTIVGVGSIRTSIKQQVQVQLQSRWDSNFRLPIQAYVMPQPLTTQVPTQTISNNHWQHLQGLNLADPSYLTPGSIDLLLGVQEYAKIIQQELIKGPPGTPCAQRTNLGWIIFGEVYTKPIEHSFLVLHQQVVQEDILKSVLEIDTNPQRKQTSKEYFNKNTYYYCNKNRRYTVKPPLKSECPQDTA